MPTRLIAVALFMLTAGPTFASDVSSDRHARAASAPLRHQAAPPAAPAQVPSASSQASDARAHPAACECACHHG